MKYFTLKARLVFPLFKASAAPPPGESFCEGLLSPPEKSMRVSGVNPKQHPDQKRSSPFLT